MRKRREPANWEERAWRALNDSLEIANTFDADRLIKELDTLSKEKRNRRVKELFFAYDSLVNSFAVLARLGKRIVLCVNCNKFYNATARTKQCPTCAKKLRQQAWQESYKKKHGHAYKQKREPAYIKKLRKIWELKPELKNDKRGLAAEAEITPEQCEAALRIIVCEKTEAGQNTAQTVS